MKKLSIATLAILAIVMLTSCTQKQAPQPAQQSESEPEPAVQMQEVEQSVGAPAQSEPYVPVLGESFHFDGFDVFLGDELAPFKVVDNKYSKENGKTVVVLPLTLLNISGEIKLFNPLFMRVYAPDGLQVKYLGTYFQDDDIYGVGKMMDGARAETHAHFEYKGDGDYFIEFNNRTPQSGMAKISVAK